MAERKIAFEDIFTEDIFARIATSAATFKDVLQELDGTLEAFGKTSAVRLRELSTAVPSAENMKKLAEATRQAEAGARMLTQARNALQKAEERLNLLRSQEGARLAEIKIQTRELTKDLAAQARSAEAAAKAEELLKKATEGTFQSYHDLQETLENLRIVYKDLAASGRGGTEEAAKLAIAIGKLDKEAKRIDATVGQFQRNVGNYTNSIRDVFIEFRAQAQQAGGQLGSLTGLLFGAADAFKAAGGGLRGFAAGTKALGQSLKSLGILALLTLLAEGIDKVAGRIKDFFSGESRRALEEAREYLRYKVEQVAQENKLALAQQRRALAGENSLEAARAEFAEKKKLLEIELKRAEREYQLARAAVAAAESREDEAQKLREAGEAYEKYEQAKRAILAVDFEERQTVKKILEARVKEVEEAKRLAIEREKQRREELAAALKELEIEKEHAATRSEQVKKEAEEARKAVEIKRLEALRLARTAEERQKIEQAAAAKLAQIARREQAQLLEIRGDAAAKLVQINQRTAERSLASELEALRAKYAAIAVEVAKEEAELGARAEETRRALAAAEQRERQELLKKYALAEIDAREEAAKNALDIEAKNFSDLQEFEKYKQQKLLEIQKQFLEERLTALRAAGAEDAEIKAVEAKLALLSLRMRQAVGATGKAMEEEFKKIASTLQGLADVFSALLERQFTRAGIVLERQLGAVRRRQDLLIAQIAAGSVAASASLAELEKQEAELIRQQEALKRQAQRREAALAIFRAYAGQLQQGVNPAQALLNTIRDFQVLAQLIRTLPTFYEGTEYVSSRTHPRVLNTTRDAFIARVHAGERIVPAEINRKLGNISNQELVEVVRGAKATAEVSFDAEALTNSLATIVKRGNKIEKIWRSL